MHRHYRIVSLGIFLMLVASSGIAAERPKLEKATLDTAHVASKVIAQARVKMIMPKFRRG